MPSSRICAGSNHAGVPDRSDAGQLGATGYDPVVDLRPRAIVPILGAIIGGLAGVAYYFFVGCHSG
jgi:hypothetical protein